MQFLQTARQILARQRHHHGIGRLAPAQRNASQHPFFAAAQSAAQRDREAVPLGHVRLNPLNGGIGKGERRRPEQFPCRRAAQALREQDMRGQRTEPVRIQNDHAA
jgi:hypothetical protein